VRLCAGFAGAKFAVLSGGSATGRTMDGKHLFRSEFVFRNGKMMAQTDVQGCRTRKSTDESSGDKEE
jgi:hypothetical protein